MFTWYRQSSICYAYIDDFDEPLDDSAVVAFTKCKWFKRGWTLQELIAPSQLEFLGNHWQTLGVRHDLAIALSLELNIEQWILERGQPYLPALSERTMASKLSAISVSRRISWAATRETTRPDDMAYALIGIFDINIPLLYGEGLRKAFFRLQEEIMKQSDDHTIFAWSPLPEQKLHDTIGVLAESPANFSKGANIVCHAGMNWKPFQMTNKGLSIELKTLSTGYIKTRKIYERERRDVVSHCIMVVLNCHEENQGVALALELVVPGISKIAGKVFTRVTTEPFDICLDYEFQYRSLLIARNGFDMDEDKDEEISFCVDMTHRVDFPVDQGITSYDFWDYELDKKLLHNSITPEYGRAHAQQWSTDSLVVHSNYEPADARGASGVKVTVLSNDRSPRLEWLILFGIRFGVQPGITILDATKDPDYMMFTDFDSYCEENQVTDSRVRWHGALFGVHASIKHTPAFGRPNLYSVEIAFENFL